MTKPIQFGSCATSATVEVAPASLAYWPRLCLDRGWLAWVGAGTQVPSQSGRPPLSPIDFARQDPCPPFPHTFCKIPTPAHFDLRSRRQHSIPDSPLKIHCQKSVKMAQEISDIKKVRIDGPRRILRLMWLTNGNDSSSRSAGERMPPVRSDRNRRENPEQLGTNVYLTTLEFLQPPGSRRTRRPL